MKKVTTLELVALKQILKLRKEGGSREDVLDLAKLLFRLKQRLIEAGLKRKGG
jgi:hypothetical protein